MAATFTSDAVSAVVPAKSGVRDTFRVPFSVTSTGTAAANDVAQLARVSIGHRVVGFYIECTTAYGTDGTTAIRYSYKQNNNAGTTNVVDVVTGSKFGTAANAAISQYGYRTSAGAVGTTPGTYATGAIPGPAFDNDGVFYLEITGAVTGGTAGAFKGYVEIQPA